MAGRFLCSNPHHFIKLMKNPFKKFDQYGLRYFLKHLIALKRWDDLTDILCNLYFVEAKCSVDMVYSLIDDYVCICTT